MYVAIQGVLTPWSIQSMCIVDCVECEPFIQLDLLLIAIKNVINVLFVDVPASREGG